MYAIVLIVGISPGGNMGFEKAPFKLTSEFIDLMDGLHSPLFRKFRCLMFLFIDVQ